VPKGIANGTIGELMKVILKQGGGQHIHKINIDGYWVIALKASMLSS
jgi:hypothetical protein